MSDILFNETSTPSTPTSGKVKVFVDSADRYLKTIDSKGVIGAVGDHEAVNYLRNSGMWFAQRQAPGTLTTYSATASRAIMADGWATTNENASVQYIRTDTSTTPQTGLQGRFYGTVTKITATGKIVVTQVLEGYDAQLLRGRTVRFQVWIKAVSGTPIVNLALIQLNTSGTVDTLPGTFISAFGANATDPTLGTNLAYIAPKSGVTPDNCTVDGNHAECTTSTSWQRFGAVFDVPSNCKNLLVAIYGDSQFAAAAGFSWTQASLTDGYEVQDWEPMQYDYELARVQRYYSKTFNVDTAPVQNAGVNTGEFRSMAPKAGAVACVTNTYYHPVRMRVASVTSTAYNPAAANAQMRDITGAVDCTVQAFAGQTERSCYVTYTGNAATAVGNSMGLHMTFDAEIL